MVWSERRCRIDRKTRVSVITVLSVVGVLYGGLLAYWFWLFRSSACELAEASSPQPLIEGSLALVLGAIFWTIVGYCFARGYGPRLRFGPLSLGSPRALIPFAAAAAHLIILFARIWLGPMRWALDHT